MRIFVLTANYELRVSRKSHLRDHPRGGGGERACYQLINPGLETGMSASGGIGYMGTKPWILEDFSS
jgi:hypothetical protein